MAHFTRGRRTAGRRSSARTRSASSTARRWNCTTSRRRRSCSRSATRCTRCSTSCGSANGSDQAMPSDSDPRDADSLAALTKAALAFRDAREWKQFHNFKDLAVTLSLEAAEVLEHAQWKTPQQLEQHLADPRQREQVADELADVLHVLLLLAEHAKIDLPA